MSTKRKTARRLEPTRPPVVPLTDKFVKEEYPLLREDKNKANTKNQPYGGFMVPQKKSYNEGVIEGFWIGFEKGFKKALMEIANSPGGTSFVEWENRVLVVEGGEGTRIPQGEIRRFPLEIKMMNGKIIIFDGDEQLAKTYGGPKQISGRGLLKPDIKPYIEAAIDELRKAGVIPTDKS